MTFSKSKNNYYDSNSSLKIMKRTFKIEVVNE